MVEHWDRISHTKVMNDYARRLDTKEKIKILKVPDYRWGLAAVLSILVRKNLQGQAKKDKLGVH